MVEDNSFHGLGGAGVALFNSPFEGLCATRHIVQRNTMLDTNQLGGDPTTTGAARVSAFPSAAAPPFCHRDLLFLNNTIEKGPGAPLTVNGVDGLVARGNVLVRCAEDATGAIEVDNAANVDVEDASNVVVNKTGDWICVKPPTGHR